MFKYSAFFPVKTLTDNFQGKVYLTSNVKMETITGIEWLTGHEMVDGKI